MFESAAPETEVFVDRDPEAFAVLLRFMRHGRVGSVLTPKMDPALCAAVISEADFLGVDSLLETVKAAATRNMLRPQFKPDWERFQTDADAAAHFDQNVGT
eukprot:3613150-Prymnesium_polylepis.1